MVRSPVPDETLTELPPLDDEGEGDPTQVGEEALEVSTDEDSLDDADAAASLGDDGLDVDEERDAQLSPDDASGLDDPHAADDDLDGSFGDSGLSADLEEPGIGDEAFDLDDPSNDDASDRGEEGPTEADEELRAEDLPELDADDDGEVAELALYEPGAFVSVPRGLGFPWADRGWEVARLSHGAFTLVAGAPGTAVALASKTLVEVRFDGPDEHPSITSRAVRTPSQATSLAVAWDDGALVVGGSEARILGAFASEWASLSPPGPVRVAGTSAGVYGLGRKGVLRRRIEGAMIPIDTPSAAGPAGALAAEDAARWVHAIGTTARGELVALVLDELSGEHLLDVGNRSGQRVPALPEDASPRSVTALGSTVVVVMDDGNVLVSWSGEDFVCLDGARSALGACLYELEGDGVIDAVVLTAHAEEDRVLLLLHAPACPARVVAVLEPREDVEPDVGDGVAESEVASFDVPAAAGGLFVEVVAVDSTQSARVLLATPFGLFAARPPRRGK